MAMPPEIDHAVVAALFQFRIATTEQLRVLHTPEARPEQMRRRLRRLKGEGLVETSCCRRPGGCGPGS
ncbi:replication-relaxation family protein [Streptomyces sp. CB01881]|uniref:replication-relaxation family protein n=1 Tax=Streptomyces sp. CB01881 TaxID=2078691 RepID=UPI000CDC2ABC|nr:replication-relaxation family protein [Streptomyces sp. CB01881]AUY53616.1 hypothetical protein C2142_37700 [Streptomyces sp. CB01881]TYC68632.1 hypothetical protein EH183_37715 [Streptomyces sp. CB01881]